LKFSKRVIGVFPASGKICEIRCVNSVAVQPAPVTVLQVPGRRNIQP
jgi:hypothetical protein